MKVFNLSTQKFSQLHFRTIGNGNPVVLLHGFPEDGSLWVPIAMELASSCLIVIPDLPGAGSSDLPAEPLTLDLMGQSVKAILDHLNIEQAVIAGHSMGGYTALAFAAQFPQMVKGLSLVHSTATADTEEKKAVRKKSIDLIKKGGKEAFVKNMIPTLFSEQFRRLHPEKVEEQIQNGLQLSAQSMIAFYEAMIQRPDRRSVLSAAAFPVQWIIGREDVVVPTQQALEQSHMAPVSSVSLYDDAGHMSMIEKPQQLLDDLTKFIDYCFNR